MPLPALLSPLVRNRACRAAAACTVAALALAATPASAHVVFAQKQAPAGSYFKGVLLVGHGCSGSATRALTVTIPDGIGGAHPQPKPGWTLTITRAPLAAPVTSHGKTITEDVRTVRWSGGTLPDAWFDEFALLMKLPEQAGKVYFPVVQECEDGRAEWTQVPAAGQSAKDLKSPAPELEITGAPEHAHHH